MVLKKRIKAPAILILSILLICTFIFIITETKASFLHKNNLTFSFELTEESPTNVEFFISIKNHDNVTKPRRENLSVLITDLNFGINASELENLRMWVHENKSITKEYWVLISEECYWANGTRYCDREWELVKENVTIAIWEDFKDQFFKRQGKVFTAGMERVTFPKGDEDKGFGYGVKEFRLRINTPLIKRASGWGTEGLMKVEMADTEFYDDDHSSWWDVSFPFRIPFIVNSSSSASLVNLTYILNEGAYDLTYVNTSDYIKRGKMNNTCSDIRILKDQTQLDYEFGELENFGCNTTQTIIFTRGNISISNETDIYMYFGKINVAPVNVTARAWHPDALFVGHFGNSTIDSISGIYGTVDNQTFTIGKIGLASGNASDITAGKIHMNFSFDYNIKKNLTIMAWIFLESDITGPIVSKYGVLNSQKSFLFGTFITGKTPLSPPRPTLVLYGYGNGLVQNHDVCGGNLIKINSWQFIAVVFKSNISIEFYVNGTLDSTCNTNLTAINSTLQYFEIGGTEYSGQYFGGDIDEVYIFNTSLSADEIKRYYDQTKSRSLNFAPFYNANKTQPAPPDYDFYLEINVTDREADNLTTTFTLNYPNGSYAKDIDGTAFNKLSGILTRDAVGSEIYKSPNATIIIGGNWSWNSTISDGSSGNFTLGGFNITDAENPSVTYSFDKTLVVEENKATEFNLSITLSDNLVLDYCKYNITRNMDASVFKNDTTFDCQYAHSGNYTALLTFTQVIEENYTLSIFANDSSSNINLTRVNFTVDMTSGAAGKDISGKSPGEIIYTGTNITLYCGDGICGREESYFTCPVDCGTFNLDNFFLNCLIGKEPCWWRQAWFLNFMFILLAISIAVLFFVAERRRKRKERRKFKWNPKHIKRREAFI